MKPRKHARRSAIAVDSDCFYAIGNSSVAKYSKESGARIAGWECLEGKPLIHLSGVVLDGRLYCAHSNYPAVPMTGSIEIWDTRTMQHVENYSFGIGTGSITWADFYRGYWYVGFAHYQNKGGEPTEIEEGSHEKPWHSSGLELPHSGGRADLQR